MKSRHTSQEIIDAYKQTGSVWRAGKLLGIAGQTVHDRLRALDYRLATQRWTPEEEDELRDLYAQEITLSEIGRRLGRSYAGVACKASELQLRVDQSTRRPRKLPRGAGWDKVSTRRHMKALAAYEGRLTQYARSNGLDVETLAQALQKHCPEQWQAYVEEHYSEIPRKVCEYCQAEFIPTNGKQRYCTRKCGTDARVDASYFGGKRRHTIGLAERTCQLCGRRDIKGLSSHHFLGKENDPDNDHLIALCQGCHKAVTFLASRTFVDDETAWEALISLSWLRRHGHEYASRTFADGHTLHITVDIDTYVEESHEQEAL